MTSSPDILIIGGGLTGTLLHLALLKTPYRLLLCEAADFSHKTEPHFDARSIAINRASQQILSGLGLWEALSQNATPIQQIQVSSQGQFGRTRLPSSDTRPLGHVIEMHRFYQAIEPFLPRLSLSCQTHLVAFDPSSNLATLEKQGQRFQIQPRLVVAADGGHSCLQTCLNLPKQTQAYEQTALITNIELKRPHHFVAHERFTPDGPLALLPLEQNRVSLVWCVHPTRANTLQQLPEPLFIKQLQQAFGYRLGAFKKIGQRVCFPLQQSVLPTPYAWPVVFVGNAAQTLHPIAGQGLNLGLRDIALLAQCLTQQPLQPELLKHYHLQREPDRQTIISATNALLQVFQSRQRPLRLLRSLALSAFELAPVAKSPLIHYASGLGGVPPDLACGLSLS